jgi:putative flippase GtrA
MIKETSKYITVGILNTLVDFFVLNALLILTSVRGGILFSLIKAIASLCGATNSYFWNKFWVFKNDKIIKIKEYFEFLFLAYSTSIFDVILSSLIINFINPPFSFITPLLWANICSVLGSLPGMIIRFLGYKKWVFTIK